MVVTQEYIQLYKKKIPDIVDTIKPEQSYENTIACNITEYCKVLM